MELTDQQRAEGERLINASKQRFTKFALTFYKKHRGRVNYHDKGFDSKEERDIFYGMVKNDKKYSSIGFYQTTFQEK